MTWFRSEAPSRAIKPISPSLAELITTILSTGPHLEHG
jgi:hypothetical protein